MLALNDTVLSFKAGQPFDLVFNFFDDVLKSPKLPDMRHCSIFVDFLLINQEITNKVTDVLYLIKQ